jgi:hypothetical protein
VEAIKVLAKLGVNKEAKDADGDTALHLAANSGHVEAIEVLAQLGVNKEGKNTNGLTPLHWAAVEGHVEAIKVLAQLGVNKDAQNTDGWTALHLVAHTGHVEAIKALAELGVQLDAQTADGETPLKLSIRMRHHQAAQLLRQLERTARTQKAAATSERAKQAGRNAAALIEEEEREQAAKAKSKVRGVGTGFRAWGERCGVSSTRVSGEFRGDGSGVPVAAPLRSLRGVLGEWGAAEGQGKGQGRSGWRAAQQGGGSGEQQRRGEHVAWGGQPPQYAEQLTNENADVSRVPRAHMGDHEGVFCS